MRKLFLPLALCIVAAGCAKDPPFAVSPTGETAVSVPTSGALPPPTALDVQTQNRPYLIGPFDNLTISVFGVEELAEREVRADSAGKLSFPLAGTIEAAGKTPEEVAGIIRERLAANFVRDPQVTVNLREAMSQRLTVDGQVREPGQYPVVGQTTLMEAVASAKGLTEFAKLEDVVIFRTVGGVRMAGLYNLRAIRRGYYNDPEVFPDDVVVVGDSPSRRLFRDLITLAPLLTSPLIVALQSASN